ncbi:hypothetical protein [Clostridioides difficile]|uniref:hypothetical protein n=1 Tax=Clostridioides difficile TaxID=1496 RepID=UPI001034EA58|nr:hypothetical protein [Clostridioides difficile]MDM9944027.1 hypothetical protein [Clostridioides difficile]
MNYKIFQGNYDKRLFYSLLGQFFAEREYKKMFPYLVNEEGSIWIVAIENNEVLGFTTFEEKKSRIIFDYTYAKTIDIEKKLLDKRFILTKDINKPIEIDLLRQNSNVKYWIDRGFNIKKETKNYIYLRKEAIKNDK